MYPEKKERNEKIKKLREEDYSIRAIAALVGISRTRVHQILNREKYNKKRKEENAKW